VGQAIKRRCIIIILFPIGGKGQRFVEKGYVTPKPFIKLDDKRIIDYALNSYPPDAGPNKHMFIVRPEYETEFGWGVSLIRQETNGPLETILKSDLYMELYNSEDELLIADCDSFMDRDELETILDHFRTTGVDGGVTVRKSVDPENSYAILDNYGFVRETAEKELISTDHTTGPYFYRRASEFCKYANLAMKDGVRSICPVYNYYIDDRKWIKSMPTLTFQHLGTPEALEKYAKCHGIGLWERGVNERVHVVNRPAGHSVQTRESIDRQRESEDVPKENRVEDRPAS